MKQFLFLASMLIMAACSARPSVVALHTACANYAGFPALAECLKSHSDSDRPIDKLYLFAAEALNQKVSKGEISEAEATLKLSEVLISLARVEADQYRIEDYQRAMAAQQLGLSLQAIGNSLQQQPVVVRPGIQAPIRCNTINSGGGYSTTSCY